MDKPTQAIRARLKALDALELSRCAVLDGEVFDWDGDEVIIVKARYLSPMSNSEAATAIYNAPADIAALLDALDAQATRIGALEDACNAAFTALAKDNTYGPGPNKAWAILGEVLGKVHSDDEGGERWKQSK
jgi:hypothetical protein